MHDLGSVGRDLTQSHELVHVGRDLTQSHVTYFIYPMNVSLFRYYCHSQANVMCKYMFVNIDYELCYLIFIVTLIDVLVVVCNYKLNNLCIVILFVLCTCKAHRIDII